jgi:G3E family GTPase
MQKMLPITVLSGFYKTGKSTLLKHLVQNNIHLRIAILASSATEDVFIAPEFGAQIKVFRYKESKEELDLDFEYTTMHSELLREVLAIAQSESFDVLILEATGAMEPATLIHAFAHAGEVVDVDLFKWVYLDSFVAMVDAEKFLADLNTEETLVDRQMQGDVEESPLIASLLTDQLEVANIIVINKIDTVEGAKLDTLRALCAQMNPKAKILETLQGQIEPSELLNKGLFNWEDALGHEHWATQIVGGAILTDAQDKGIETWVYKARKPFHPERLWAFFNESYPHEILRGKGLFWIAARPEDVLVFSTSGPTMRLDWAGVWWSAMSDEERRQEEDYDLLEADAKSQWDDQWEDRHTEMVFIGMGLNTTYLKQQLDHCLVTPEELSAYAEGVDFVDPFPDFDDEADEEDVTEEEMGNAKEVPNE